MEWNDTLWLAWVGGALVLGLIEVASLDLVFVMLSGGALAAAAAAGLGVAFPGQVFVFVLTSALLLLVARPLALRKLKPQGPEQRTGTSAHVGRRAEVVETVSAKAGLVKLAGEHWTARSADPARTFEIGESVTVVRIEGATALVDATPPGEPAPQPAPQTTPQPEEKP